MKRLNAEIERIQRRIVEHATASCEVVDALSTHTVTPAEFNNLQRGLRQSLLFVESRLESLRHRIRRRGGFLKRACGSRDGFGRFLGEYQDALRGRERELERERRLIRQSGDVLAWIALDSEPNIIAPLFDDATHMLPKGLGLGGVAQIASDAHATGQFLAVENDLTRCLGVGDLTVVPYRRKWSQPLSLEIKTEGVLGRDEFATVNLHAVKMEGTTHEALILEFMQALSLNPGGAEGSELQRKNPAQAEKLMSRGKYLHELGQIEFKRVEEPDDQRWDRITRVVEKALDEGIAVEVTEENVARVAVRQTSKNPDAVAGSIKKKLDPLGFTAESEQGSSFDFQNQDDLSAVIAPIAMWRVPLRVRVALLASEVEFSTVLAPRAWEKAFEAVGLTLQESRQGWKIDGGFQPVIIYRLMSERIRLGAFFEGLSLSHTATAIKNAIDRLDPDGSRSTLPSDA